MGDLSVARKIRDDIISQAETVYMQSVKLAKESCDRAVSQAPDAASKARAGKVYDEAEEYAREILDISIADAWKAYETSMIKPVF